MGSSSFDCSPARETTTAMCMESASSGRGRRGKNNSKASSSSEHGGKAATKQPQRGLGVAQLEKIRLHNQMMAAYRSAAAHLHDQAPPQEDHHHLHRDAAGSGRAAHFDLVPPPFAAVAGGGASSFQPYHHLTSRFSEETDRGGARYYDDLLPYRTPSLYAHDVRDSSGHRLGQPQEQQHCWIMGSRSHDDGSSAEELDLELRL